MLFRWLALVPFAMIVFLYLALPNTFRPIVYASKIYDTNPFFVCFTNYVRCNFRIHSTKILPHIFFQVEKNDSKNSVLFFQASKFDCLFYQCFDEGFLGLLSQKDAMLLEKNDLNWFNFENCTELSRHIISTEFSDPERLGLKRQYSGEFDYWITPIGEIPGAVNLIRATRFQSRFPCRIQADSTDLE